MSPSNGELSGLDVVLSTPPLSAPFKYILPPVPLQDLSMFIFLGSCTPSVQNIKSSRTFIPVMIISLWNSKTGSAWNLIASVAVTVIAVSIITFHLLTVVSYNISVTLMLSPVLYTSLAILMPIRIPDWLNVELDENPVIWKLFWATVVVVLIVFLTWTISTNTYLCFLVTVLYSNI